MGLDMFAFATSHKPGEPVDFGDPEDAVLFHEWRKHSNLHVWMEKLYFTKGGKDKEFNCMNLELSSGELDRLEAAILADDLPDTEGKFFGESDGSELDDDLAFVAKARDYLAGGLTIYYTSWW